MPSTPDRTPRQGSPPKEGALVGIQQNATAICIRGKYIVSYVFLLVVGRSSVVNCSQSLVASTCRELMPELECLPTEGCRVGEADRLCLIPAISEQAFRDIPEDMSEVGAMRGLKTATV